MLSNEVGSIIMLQMPVKTLVSLAQQYYAPLATHHIATKPPQQADSIISYALAHYMYQSIQFLHLLQDHIKMLPCLINPQVVPKLVPL